MARGDKMQREEPTNLVRVLGIVQARMLSTRLPGKVLMMIGPKTALEWTVERVRMANSVDEVVVATTSRQENVPIVELCRRRKWATFVYEGDERDCLSRVYYAAGVYSPNVIVDITSDCPFVDPRHIDLCVAKVLRGAVDYASNLEPRSWPDGFDVQAYKMSALIKMHEHKDANRGHSGWNAMKIKSLTRWSHAATKQYSYPSWRLTLDTLPDLTALRMLYDMFIKYQPSGVTAEDIIQYIKHEQSIIRINSLVRSTTPGL